VTATPNIGRARGWLALLVLVVGALALAPPASADSGSLLLYGPSIYGSPDTEATLASSLGYTVTIASDAAWQSMTTAQFASYNAIVIGDPTCGTAGTGAAANRAVWSAAVTGPVVVIGTDPIYHQSEGIGEDRLVQNGIRYAASGTHTGLYASLSCAYTGGGPVDLLDRFGSFATVPQDGCPDNAHVVDAAHPVMTGLDSTLLSNWGCSIHDALSSVPPQFEPLAIDGDNGLPYIVATPTGDTQPPSPVGNLTAQVRTGFVISLGWTASTDNVGVDHYAIQRDGSLLATTTGTSYTDASVVAGSTHTYTVIAYDAAGNHSDPRSVTITDTDTTPPSAPHGLHGQYLLKKGKPQIHISWFAATDNVAVAGYRVLRDGTLIKTTANKTYMDKTVSLGHTYTYVVQAYDTSGNVGPSSNAVTIRTGDTTPPSTPTGLAASIVAGPSVSLTWTPSTDDVAVDHYDVLRGGVDIASTPTASFVDSTVAQGQSYTYRVVAYDTSGNASGASAPVTQAVPDVTPPTAPGDVQATPVNPTTVKVTWDPASDNVAVTGYEVLRDGVQIATVGAGATSYTDATLPSVLTTFTYRMRAFDAAGNRSALSNAAPAVTPFGDAFETGNMLRWSSVVGNVTAQTAVVYNGLYAARSVSTGAPAYALLNTGSPQSNLYYRMFLNVQHTGPQGVYFMTFKTAAGTPLVSVYRTNSGVLAIRNELAGTVIMSSTPVTLGGWHELQTHVVVEGENSEFGVWYDGVKQVGLSVPQSLGSTPIGQLQLGSSASGRNWDVAYDKVGVSTQFMTY
jgi:chitodextrinase